MSSYCLKSRKNTKNVDPVVSKTSNGKTMILSKYAICGSKRSRFIKKQEPKGILTSLGFKIGLDKIPFLEIILLSGIMYKKNAILLFKAQKNIERINPRVPKTLTGKTIILSKCVICNTKKSRFIKKQEGTGILSNLGLKTPLSKIPLLGDIFF